MSRAVCGTKLAHHQSVQVIRPECFDAVALLIENRTAQPSCGAAPHDTIRV